MATSLKAFRTGNGKVIDAAATQAALRKNMRIYCETLVKSLRQDYITVPEGPNYIRKYKPGGGRAAANSFHPRGRRRTSQGARGVGVGGGWKISVSSDGTIGEVYNDVPYAKYVQGHQGDQSYNNLQAGWGSIDDHAAATRAFFNKLMGDAIQTGIGKARRERNQRGQFV